MTSHHCIVLLKLEEAGSQATVEWISRETSLSLPAVSQAGMELSHKKMIKRSGIQHTCLCGKNDKVYAFRISKLGRSMVDRIKQGKVK